MNATYNNALESKSEQTQSIVMLFSLLNYAMLIHSAWLP